MPDRDAAIRFIEDAISVYRDMEIDGIDHDSDLENRYKGHQRRLVREDHAEAVKLIKELKRANS